MSMSVVDQAQGNGYGYEEQEVDAWLGFSDDSADEDQHWVERDEWHEWRNRIDDQVSGALGTATAEAALGRYARLQTKVSKADRTNPLEFGRNIRQASKNRAQREAKERALQKSRNHSDDVQNTTTLDPKKFQHVVVPPQEKRKTDRRRRGSRSRSPKKKQVLDLVEKAHRAHLRKLDAARWERRGDRIRFLSQYDKRPSYQHAIETMRKTGHLPTLPVDKQLKAADRLHRTSLMSNIVAKKVDPQKMGDDARRERVELAKEEMARKAAKRKKSKAAALNFGISVNILSRQMGRAAARKQKADRLQQTVSQTKFRRKKQQLAHAKWGEYNDACDRLKKQIIHNRYEDLRNEPRVELETPAFSNPTKAARRRHTAEAKVNFLHKGDKTGPFGPGRKAIKASAATAAVAKIHRKEAGSDADFLPQDATTAAAAASNLHRFMPLPKSVAAYRSYGAVGEAVVPPFGTSALPRDSEHQVKLYDAMTGPKM